MHMALLLGYVEDILINTIMAAEHIELPTRIKIMGAWSKVLWIQNDLFGKYYAKSVDEAKKKASGAKGIWEGVLRDVMMASIGGVFVIAMAGLLR